MKRSSSALALVALVACAAPLGLGRSLAGSGNGAVASTAAFSLGCSLQTGSGETIK